MQQEEDAAEVIVPGKILKGAKEAVSGSQKHYNSICYHKYDVYLCSYDHNRNCSHRGGQNNARGSVKLLSDVVLSGTSRE